MKDIALLLTGFSVFSSLILILTHFNRRNYPQQPLSVVFGILLVSCIVILQLYHFSYIRYSHSVLSNSIYLITLFLIAPFFYYFARGLLIPVEKRNWPVIFHLLPIIFVFVFPASISFPLAFIIGSGYLLWLILSLYKLRNYHKNFLMEITIFSIIFIIASVVSLIVLTMPFSEQLFFYFYSSAIGFAILLIVAVLGYSPQLSENITEVASEAYEKSTLLHIDCDNKTKELETIMASQKLYRQSNLDLFTVASELGLSSHQLSELLNSRLGKSFSRYLRELRVSESKDLLVSGKNQTVLEVGLQVGFSSQSNFYNAFKEITGTSPAKYRKLADSLENTS